MAKIELRGLGKRFRDGTVAVRDVDLTIHDGELFVLVGPSGCGKSTLLELVAGLQRPSTGEVLVDGRSMSGVDPKDRNMAMVFQSYALYPHLSVRGNLAFPLDIRGVEGAERERRIREAAEVLELTDLLDRKPATLSGGQRQRVAMGRALVRDPAAFLLDEPLSNLDAQLRVQMRSEIARLHRRLGSTTLYVTHDQSEALTLADRMAVLSGGVVQQVGTPAELYHAPANRFVASFVGSPPMSFVRGRRVGREIVLPFGRLPWPEAAPPAPESVDVGVRPGSVREVPPAEAPGGDAIRFRAGVELLEWTGSETHAHVRVDAGSDPVRLVARLDAGSGAREGDDIELCIRVGELHVFDPDSGARLPYVQGGPS